METIVEKWEEDTPRYMLGNLHESSGEALDVLERWLLLILQAVRDARDYDNTPF